MTYLERREDAKAHNSEVLEKLKWIISTSSERFSLTVSHCNYSCLQDTILLELSDYFGENLNIVELNKGDILLLQKIQDCIKVKGRLPVIVVGLESVNDLNSLLIAANQSRDEFQKLLVPLVVCANDEVLDSMIHLAPDFESWRADAEIKFEMSVEELLLVVEEKSDLALSQVLSAGAGKLLYEPGNGSKNCKVSGLSSANYDSNNAFDLKNIRSDLKSREVVLSADLEAACAFTIGLSLDDSCDESRKFYWKALLGWKRSDAHVRYACALFYLGRWHRTFAERHPERYSKACNKAQRYFGKSIAAFEESGHLDLVGKFINALGDVLQRLEKWQELEVVANKALTLHKSFPVENFRLARIYGFKAQVELSRNKFSEARQFAESAIDCFDIATSDSSTRASTEEQANREWETSYHKGWYLLSLAKALYYQDEIDNAIEHLKTAKEITNPQYDVKLYSAILKQIQLLFREKCAYKAAFYARQERVSIEQQYGLRGFVGAARLQPEKLIANPILQAVSPETRREKVSKILKASGRNRDLDELVERLTRNYSKLTVLHGYSGVGKSSLLQAGLIPRLKSISIDGKAVRPVLIQQGYDDLANELERKVSFDFCQVSARGDDLTQALIRIESRLKAIARSGKLLVFIFDQFEEFFFLCKGSSNQRLFSNFLEYCLNKVPEVKIIFSIRQDCLHLLLDLKRWTNLNIINGNILDQSILYSLGKLSASNSKMLIRDLTAKVPLEPLLISQLVEDLSDESGEVLPVELQVVGSQLQDENISSIEKYREEGGKEQLVKRYLQGVLSAVGETNQASAQLVIFSLTSKSNRRLLKSRSDLSSEITIESQNLKLILDILVSSGLVFRIPGEPESNYQLVHDYLVPLIRNSMLKQAENSLSAEIEQNTQQKKKAKISEVNALIGLSGVLSSSHNQLKALVVGLIAGLKSLEIEKAPSEQKIKIVKSLRRVLYRISESNRFEGHSYRATCVCFSPDGSKILSSSADKTLKLWGLDGEELVTFRGHCGWVRFARFSSDAELILSASGDKTLKLWRPDGTLIRTLAGHTERVFGAVFSPDNQSIISASADKTIKIWSTQDGVCRKTIEAHTEWIRSVEYSPDGEYFISASYDKTVKLWSKGGEFIRSFEGHEDRVFCASFSPDGQLVASCGADRTIRLWNLNGELLRVIWGHRSKVRWVKFTADSKAIVSASYDKTVRLWNINGTLLKKFKGHQERVLSCDVAPNGKVFVSASDDKTIRIWQLVNSHDSLKILGWHEDTVNSVNFSPNNELLVSTSNDKTVKIWNRSGAALHTLKGHDAPVLYADFSPDGKVIASASADKTVRLWSTKGELLLKLEAHNDRVLCVKFSPDGKFFASASFDKSIKIWTVKGELLKVLTGHTSWVRCLSFSSDSKVLASAGSDNIIILWDLERELALPNERGLESNFCILEGHNGTVRGISFSPDDSFLASASFDKTVKLWGKDGKCIKTFYGHTERVYSASFNPTNTLIVSASFDKRIKFWPIDGDRSIASYQLHDERVYNAAFSPDGKMVAMASADCSVKILNVNEPEFYLDVDQKLDRLISSSYQWLANYFRTNKNVSEEERLLVNKFQNDDESRIKEETMLDVNFLDQRVFAD